MVEPASSSQVTNIAAFNNEWAVLLECASPAHQDHKLVGLIRKVDWTRLLVLAEEHGIIGHLAARMREIGGDIVPPDMLDALVERQRAQLFFTLRMTAELFRLLERFAAAEIGALVVKGPVLAVQAYGDPAMRFYGDLDLLVRQRDIRHATEVMIADGYASKIPLSAIDAGKIPGQYLFSKPESKLIVELHNDRTLRYFPRPLPLDRFFDRQIRVRLDAHEVPALSVEDELVLICIHGAKHFWERLTWIADVAALVSRQRESDWERVAATAGEIGAERMLHTGLCLAAKLLAMPLPERFSLSVQGDAVAARLAAQVLKWLPAAGYAAPGLFERAVFRMRMRGSWLAAPTYLLRLSLFPTEEDWQKGSQLSQKRFLDALRRPFRLARKYSRSPRD
jgi:putative nucleotidyltransferase-like protein